jgi:hypothetical protein
MKSSFARVSQKDVRWLATASAWPDTAPERECVRSALQTSYALVSFLDGHVGDDVVGNALTHNATAPLRQLRVEESNLWPQGHDPAAIAAYHLPRCMAMTGVELANSPTLQQCLKETEPVALASIFRYTGRTLPDAVAAMTARYTPQVLKADPASIAERVYTLPTESDDLSLREQVFIGCLSAALSR